MHVISKKRLKEFYELHTITLGPLTSWYDFVKKAQWQQPADVKRDFGDCSLLPDNRVVFNIKGNNYRLVVRINYPLQCVYIRFVGTHADYDRIDATKI